MACFILIKRVFFFLCELATRAVEILANLFRFLRCRSPETIDSLETVDCFPNHIKSLF